MYECIATFIACTLLLWYLKPSLLFVDNEPKTYTIADVEINMFAITVVIIAIFTYYAYVIFH